MIPGCPAVATWSPGTYGVAVADTLGVGVLLGVAVTDTDGLGDAGGAVVGVPVGDALGEGLDEPAGAAGSSFPTSAA